MATSSLGIKRKNIDLPLETFHKLSLLAVAQGKSLKAYIESILISKADSVSIEIKENPSPSCDKWFEDENNIALVNQGIQQAKEGRKTAYSVSEIRKMLGV